MKCQPTDKNVYSPILTMNWNWNRSINAFQTIDIVFHYFHGTTHCLFFLLSKFDKMFFKILLLIICNLMESQKYLMNEKFVLFKGFVQFNFQLLNCHSPLCNNWMKYDYFTSTMERWTTLQSWVTILLFHLSSHKCKLYGGGTNDVATFP